MQLILVRHAIAEERDPARWPDDSERPLTPSGQQRFREAAAGLGRVTANPDLVWSSPYKRAMATASILAEVSGWPAARECPALAPGGGVGATLDAVRSEPGAGTVGLVGHEPDLGQLLAYLLTGDERGLAVDFRKGGAAIVDFGGPPQPGAGRLISFVPPRIARRLGG